MRYLILIAGDEKAFGSRPPAELAQIKEQFRAYGESLKTDGHYVMGSQLHPSGAATTFRQRSGKLEMIDGPFVETKEQLGGFYLIEAKDLDEALAVAKRCPGTAYGSVEVRPAMMPLQ